jgi:hypothetical protein
MTAPTSQPPPVATRLREIQERCDVLRTLCPRVVTPKCERGDGVCIPCNAADDISFLLAEIGYPSPSSTKNQKD